MNALLAVLMQTCVIVIPTDHVPGNYPPDVVERHERAHCAGMTTEDIIPPKRYRKLPRGMKLEVVRVPTVVAEKICKAMGGERYACSWFE